MSGLKQFDIKFAEYMTIGCDRIKIYGKYAAVSAANQQSYYSIQVINQSLILCCVHMPSDLHRNMADERYNKARMIISDINVLQEKYSTQNVIIAGDFNEMPYERGMLNADAFHALPIYDDRASKSRKVEKTDYQKFYNPMWNFFGDFRYPPGTYFRNSSILHSPMWYILDGFIVSYDLAPLLNKDELKVITQCGYGKLYDHNGRPDIKHVSDHFPVVCELNLQE